MTTARRFLPGFCLQLALSAIGLGSCRHLHSVAASAALTETVLTLDYAAFKMSGTSQYDIKVIPTNLTAVFTVTYDPSAAKSDLPILFLLPGWNLPAQNYTQLTEALTSKGYVVVVAETAQTFPFSVEGMPLPGCPAEQLVSTAATLSLFSHEIDQFEEALGPRAGSNPEVVILGHRNGAWAALLAASGQCDNLRTIRDPEAMVYCMGYTSFQGTIRGVISDELSVNVPGTGFNLIGDTFVLFLTGPIDSLNVSTLAYEHSSGACTTRVQLSGDMNGYAWADYLAEGNPNGQWPSCVTTRPEIPVWKPTVSEHQAALDLNVAIIDAATRAAVLGDETAVEFLAGLGEDPRVAEAMGTACL